MLTRFTKMHGLGNDFVVFNAIDQTIMIDSKTARAVADRHFGIGCDQILLVEPTDRKGVDFRYRIFNADGAEVSQCGNGARCFARYVSDQGLTQKSLIRVQTDAGLLTLKINDDESVTVDMGVPTFEPAQIPIRVDSRAAEYEIEIAGETIRIMALSIGNPHAVQWVDNITSAPVATQGPLIEVHSDFPDRVNAGFAQRVNSGHVRLRVYERGVGETLACGSGACAAVVAGRSAGQLDETVQVDLPGGSLSVTWLGEGKPVMMTGPAETVYNGEVDLAALLK